MQDSKKYPLHQFFYEEWIAPLVDLHTKLREGGNLTPPFDPFLPHHVVVA